MIGALQPVTKDNCDFPSIRQSKCVYVDKTAWLHRMATDPEAHFLFLARPRRFGKSLMISTLKALFQGRRDLFEGLAIMDTDWDWEAERRPVILIDEYDDPVARALKNPELRSSVDIRQGRE